MFLVMAQFYTFFSSSFSVKKFMQMEKKTLKRSINLRSYTRPQLRAFCKNAGCWRLGVRNWWIPAPFEFFGRGSRLVVRVVPSRSTELTDLRCLNRCLFLSLLFTLSGTFNLISQLVSHNLLSLCERWAWVFIWSYCIPAVWVLFCVKGPEYIFN